VVSLLQSATGGNPQKVTALDANYGGIVTGLLVASVFAAAGVALVYFAVRRRLAPAVFTAAAALVMVLDVGLSLRLWDESKGYIRSVPPPEQYFAPDEAITFLRPDTTLYRVMPLNYQRSDAGVLMGHGIQSAGGQLPNPLQNYQDFIGAGASVMFQAPNLSYPNFLNLLNVKYIISYTLPEDISRYDRPTQMEIRRLQAFFDRPEFTRAFAGNSYTIYHNRDALPRAFLAPGFEVVADKDALLSRLMRPDFDPARTVLLYEDPGPLPAVDSTPGTARITDYDANRIVVETEGPSAALLVLSENHHPDWRATVDGEPADVLRAFHTLRAVRLEPGRHEVVFRYDSPTVRLGTAASLASVLLLVVCGAVSFVRRRRSARPVGRA